MSDTILQNAVTQTPLPAYGSSVPGSFTREQFKALTIATLGGILEFYEFVIFIYLASIIGQAFFPLDVPLWIRQAQTLAIFAAGYLVRPIGGIVLASIGDFVGRKKMFAITLFMMAAPTLLIGFLPTYAQIGVLAPLLLLLCRVVQGLSIGGELPGALCFVAEHVKEKRLGVSCGILAGSLAIGALLGAGVVALFTAQLGKDAMLDYGWRIPFIVGGMFGFLSAYLRRFAHETPVFEEMRQKKMLSKELPIKTLMANHKAELFMCILLACMTAAVTSGVHQFPVVFMQNQLGFDAAMVHKANFWMLIALIVGDIFAGWLADRIGAAKAFVGGAVGLILSILWLYTNLTEGDLVLRYIVTGFFSGCVSISFMLLVLSFHAQIRFTGIAASYNLAAAIVGGTTPLVLTLLTHYNKMWVAYYPIIFCSIAIFIAPILWRRRKPITPF
ncbi:MAG: MFS transporter [Polaromonas sp.]